MESFNVAPRYTPGSPGMVDGNLARLVAWQERDSYLDHVDGSHGEEGADKAARLGLKGIAEQLTEDKAGWNVVDLITGDRFWRGKVRATRLQLGDRIVDIVSGGWSARRTASDVGKRPSRAEPWGVEGWPSVEGAKVYIRCHGDRFGFAKSAMLTIERPQPAPVSLSPGLANRWNTPSRAKGVMMVEEPVPPDVLRTAKPIEESGRRRDGVTERWWVFGTPDGQVWSQDSQRVIREGR